MIPKAAETVDATVLMAVRNESEHLPALVGSLLEQTHANYRVFVVDDASEDSTRSTLDAWAATDRRVTLAPPSGRLGKVRAFNAAFELAERCGLGDFVMFAHGDDTLPPDSIASRAEVFARAELESLTTFVMAKLRTMSDDPALDGVVIPRRDAGNPSGPTIALGQRLARRVFPIPEILPSEDLWIAGAARRIASSVVELPSVVVNYRVHPGNTAPRMQSFASYTEAMHDRYAVYGLLAESERLDFSESARHELRLLERAEQLRYSRRPGRILMLYDLPLRQRLRMAALSHPGPYWVRQHWWRQLSGH